MKKQLALALLLAAAPFAASAGELSYTYVEGGYANDRDRRTTPARRRRIEATTASSSRFGRDGRAFYVFGGYAAAATT